MSLVTTKKLGWPILILLTLIPVILWALAYPLDQRFVGANGQSTYRMTMTALGQLFGIVGMAMFALNFVLSARLAWIEGLFGGMNRVYIAHHVLGGLAFVFLLFHPLFLAARYIVYDSGFVSGAKMFLFSSDSAINYGIIGLGLMQIFLILTFFVKLPYQMWKFTHKFLALAFFFGGLHVLLIPSDVTTVQHLQWYMWFLITIGTLSIFYRTLLPFLFVPTQMFEIIEIRNETPLIWEIRLKPTGSHSFDFKPGQFMFVGFPEVPELKEVHPFSISSAPTDGSFTVGIKALGDYTKQLGLLKVGMRAEVEGPFGRTSHIYYQNKKQVWIAGGIGITPFLGMARSLKPEDGYLVDLYFSLVDESDQPFVAELNQIALQNPNFRFIPWFSKKSGYLTADVIVEKSQGVLGKEIFLCGPPPMMKTIKEQFKKWGIKSSDIHSEEFSIN